MREFPDGPIVAVGGVVCLGDRILLVKRATDPGKGTWSIPGGAVRLGESLKEAVVREVKEETGLDVEAVEHLGIVERIEREQGRVRFHYVIVDYSCRVKGGMPKAGSDAEDLGWFAFEELKTLGLSPEALSLIERAMRIGRLQTGQ